MTQPAKHTPGPWQVNDSTENDDDTTLTIFAPADEVEIATMSAYENGCECFSEIRENAHLIAAAPAMYEALQQLVHVEQLRKQAVTENDYVDLVLADSKLQQLVQAVLAQAEGRQG